MKNYDDLVRICKKVYNRGFSPGYSSNISIRKSSHFVITPSGFSLETVEKDDLIELDFEAQQLAGKTRASSEKLMHLHIYKKRPDVNAIIHCHAPKISAFAVAGNAFEGGFILAEVPYLFGSEIPLVDYLMPSSIELAEAASNALKHSDAAILKNHGVIVAGKTLDDAFYKLDTIEYVAQVYLDAKQLGNMTFLAKEETDKLLELRNKAH
ncbi:MAG: class II aldolase/adducin family protein [Candidatus Gastranaerophilales bacterium]|nr:class II aldolase/adducin family protein [Candidatus Gastranaerophilales bacterium]